jgi:hypothetical protein
MVSSSIRLEGVKRLESRPPIALWDTAWFDRIGRNCDFDAHCLLVLLKPRAHYFILQAGLVCEAW